MRTIEPPQPADRPRQDIGRIPGRHQLLKHSPQSSVTDGNLHRLHVRFHRTFRPCCWSAGLDRQYETRPHAPLNQHCTAQRLKARAATRRGRWRTVAIGGAPDLDWLLALGGVALPRGLPARRLPPGPLGSRPRSPSPAASGFVLLNPSRSRVGLEWHGAGPAPPLLGATRRPWPLARKAARTRRRPLGDTLTDLRSATPRSLHCTPLNALLPAQALDAPATTRSTTRAFFLVDQRLHPLRATASTRLRNCIRAAGLADRRLRHRGPSLACSSCRLGPRAPRRPRGAGTSTTSTALLLNLMIGALAYLLVPAVWAVRSKEQGQNAAASQAQHAMLEVFDAAPATAQGVAWIAAHGGEHFTAPRRPCPRCTSRWLASRDLLSVRARSAIRHAGLPGRAIS